MNFLISSSVAPDCFKTCMGFSGLNNPTIEAGGSAGRDAGDATELPDTRGFGDETGVDAARGLGVTVGDAEARGIGDGMDMAGAGEI